MKETKYIGIFTNIAGKSYSLTVDCRGFLQAFFLLTADAIRNGSHYQLSTIIDECGAKREVEDIMNITKLLK